MRPYAELLAHERKTVMRIFTLLFCALQMATLITRFSHHWSQMDRNVHFMAIVFLLIYPFIALYSLKKRPDPFFISVIAYALLGLTATLPLIGA